VLAAVSGTGIVSAGNQTRFLQRLHVTVFPR
jgi:hypothetical protein